MHHATRLLNGSQREDLLRQSEQLCREHAAKHGQFDCHLDYWRTPGGSGVSGNTLYLVGGRWYVSKTPCEHAPGWDTVADHLRTYWRPLAAIDRCLDAVLPPCGCEPHAR